MKTSLRKYVKSDGKVDNREVEEREDKVENKNELFRNTLLYSTHLMTEQEFQ